MERSTRRLLFFVVGVILGAHAVVILDLPHLLQAIAVLVLTALLPGALFVEALVGRSSSPPTRFEQLLLSIAAGYAVMVLVMLGVSYLPGGVTTLQTFLAYDLVLVVLASVVVWISHKRSPRVAPGPEFPDADPQIWTSRWMLVGLATLLVVAFFFRFTNLGYAEYQGDEARAALRAAAIIQGYDDVLFLHKKGPTEILLPTVIYAMTGQLTETSARLPFAVANLAGLFATLLLGWRLLNPLSGWLAAMLLALDGYFIGFARIVQYQSVVFLTSVLVLLILYRLLRRPRATISYLSLAAVLLATGLLSHYEAALAAIPALYLLGLTFWRYREQRRRLTWATVTAVVIGATMLAAFYVPFVLHPHFRATYTYLADRRIGGQFPYNNLADFFLRTTVYSTTYYFVLLVALTLIALTFAYRKGLGSRPGTTLGGVFTVIVFITIWNPTWLTFGETDLIGLPFIAAWLLVLLLPKISAEERLLWLWFGSIMILAFFFTEKPRTHVYTFFMPWMLLCASVLARGWFALERLVGFRTASWLGAGGAAVAILLFGSYEYWYFVHNQTEILRTWDDGHPAGYWTAYDEPDNRALFGFPLANGWKVIGSLYDQGVLSGDYETNEKEAWVPAWYTRGQHRCGRSADWYFEIDNLEPFNDGDRKRMEHFLRHGFSKWGVVEINDVERMVIYQRTGAQSDMPTEEPTDGLPRLQLDEYSASFDTAANPDLPLTYPSIDSAIGNPLHVNFGNLIWLEGYDLEAKTPLRPGDTIRLTLYWRAQEPIFESYKVFNQSYFGDGVMIAQRDGFPVCDSRETWRWDPGELITDVYDIPINDDAPDGLYPLYSGLYLEETFERLPVLDEEGNEIETQVHLTDIRIGEE